MQSRLLQYWMCAFIKHRLDMWACVKCVQCAAADVFHRRQKPLQSICAIHPKIMRPSVVIVSKINCDIVADAGKPMKCSYFCLLDPVSHQRRRYNLFGCSIQVWLESTRLMFAHWGGILWRCSLIKMAIMCSVQIYYFHLSFKVWLWNSTVAFILWIRNSENVFIQQPTGWLIHIFYGQHKRLLWMPHSVSLYVQLTENSTHFERSIVSSFWFVLVSPLHVEYNEQMNNYRNVRDNNECALCPMIASLHEKFEVEKACSS